MSEPRTRLASLALLFAVAASASHCVAQNRYSIRRIAALPSHFGGAAAAIDNSGLVVGTSNTTTGYSFSGGATQPLPDAAGGFTSMAFAVDSRGRRLGSARTASGWDHGAIWAPGGNGFTLTTLPPAAGDLFASARASVVSSLVVGITDNGLNARPAAWERQNGAFVPTALPLLSGDFDGSALGVEPTGAVVGYSSRLFSVRAARWAKVAGAWTVAQLPGIGGSSTAADANLAGEVCGSGFAPGSGWNMVGWNMVGWPQPTTAVNLGQLPGIDTFATAINNSGDVVGYARNAGDWTAVARLGGLGVDAPVVDLNTLLPPQGPWQKLWVANDINDHGDIVGYGDIGGFLQSFVMSPVDLQLTVTPGLAGMRNEWRVTGATPGNVVFFFFDSSGGEVVIPGCAQSVDLASINFLGFAVADASGVARFSMHVHGFLQDATFLHQAFQWEGCKISDVRVVAF